MKASFSLPRPPTSLPFAVSTKGDARFAEPLAQALRCQWAFGFPTVPKPGLQLTHGFYQYPAGMQPVAAAHMLSILPPGLLLDPFVGGGTTLVEGMRCGWQTVGADASPLAVFTSVHHTWLASDDQLALLRKQASEVLHAVDPTYQSNSLGPNAGTSTAAPGSNANEWRPVPQKHLKRQAKLDGGRRGDATTFESWAPIRAQVEAIIADQAADQAGENLLSCLDPGGDAHVNPAALSPLWFAFATAQQRSVRYRFADPLAAFDATVNEYCTALRSLRAQTAPSLLAGSSPPAARLCLSDARTLSLGDLGMPLADAVLTSPHYERPRALNPRSSVVRASLGLSREAASTA